LYRNVWHYFGDCFKQRVNGKLASERSGIYSVGIIFFAQCS